MGFFRSLFGGVGRSEDTPVEAAPAVEAPAADVESAPEQTRVEIDTDAAELSLMYALGLSESGSSVETFGETMNADRMTALYRLDKLVRLGLVKRSRPMFREPEVYELTDAGREYLAKQD